MKVKSGLFRRLLTVATRWQCTTGYIHNDSLFVTRNDEWYRIMLPATLKDIDATFAVDDLKTAISTARGYCNVMLTPISLSIETKVVLLEPKHFQLPPQLRTTDQTGQVISSELEGAAWTTFIARTAPLYVAWDSIQDVFQGVLFDGTGETLTLVASNGICLLHYDTGTPANKIRVTVPRGMCTLWQTTEKFTVSFEREYVTFRTEDEEITGKMSMTIFPTYVSLLDKGKNALEFRSDDILFAKKIKAPYVAVRMREKYMLFEWYNCKHTEYTEDQYNGEQKVTAKCSTIGKVSFATEIFKLLADYGPVITVNYSTLGNPMVTSLGGYTYVFRGNWTSNN